MRCILLLGLVPWLLSADEHWVRFTSGPFEVMSTAGTRTGRDTLVRFEEFRHALGQTVGEPDLQPALPVRILILRDAAEWRPEAPIGEGRDRYVIVLDEKAAVSTETRSALATLLLSSTTSRMPEAIERGLVSFFSTLEVNGIHISAGAPPATPDLDWARIHLLVTDPEYASRSRVLFYNLRKGVPADAAYRNAIGKTPAEVDELARRHLAAGNFQVATLSSRPMAPTDFPERSVSEADARLARADLLAGSRSEAEYRALLKDNVKVPEAEEGLGILALRAGRKDEARTHFDAAIKAGSGSARAFIEYAKLEQDDEKANQALLKAAGINPKLDEPFAIMAKRDTDLRKRQAHWKAAAERNPRNAAYWQALAETCLAAHDYAGAAKAWTAGEQNATDPAQRERMHQARMAVEQQRLDYEADEKRRQADAEARDIEKLKEQARAEVRGLESKYSDPKAKPSGTVVPWWDGPKPGGKASGQLTQVDCLGKQARLIVADDNGKTVRLLVLDPHTIALSGPGDLALGCGPQKPRRVTIEYFPKPNARLGTAGEVATIEFQ
jgi:hypothetical protein